MLWAAAEYGGREDSQGLRKSAETVVQLTSQPNCCPRKWARGLFPTYRQSLRKGGPCLVRPSPLSFLKGIYRWTDGWKHVPNSSLFPETVTSQEQDQAPHFTFVPLVHEHSILAHFLRNQSPLVAKLTCYLFIREKSLRNRGSGAEKEGVCVSWPSLCKW